jgi:hypothetical protein
MRMRSLGTMGTDGLTAAQRSQAELARAMKASRTRRYQESTKKDDDSAPKCYGATLCTSYNGMSNFSVMKGTGKKYGGYGH